MILNINLSGGGTYSNERFVTSASDCDQCTQEKVRRLTFRFLQTLGSTGHGSNNTRKGMGWWWWPTLSAGSSPASSSGSRPPLVRRQGWAKQQVVQKRSPDMRFTHLPLWHLHRTSVYSVYCFWKVGAVCDSCSFVPLCFFISRIQT